MKLDITKKPVLMYTDDLYEYKCSLSLLYIILYIVFGKTYYMHIYGETHCFQVDLRYISTITK